MSNPLSLEGIHMSDQPGGAFMPKAAQGIFLGDQHAFIKDSAILQWKQDTGFRIAHRNYWSRAPRTGGREMRTVLTFPNETEKALFMLYFGL